MIFKGRIGKVFQPIAGVNIITASGRFKQRLMGVRIKNVIVTLIGNFLSCFAVRPTIDVPPSSCVITALKATCMRQENPEIGVNQAEEFLIESTS